MCVCVEQEKGWREGEPTFDFSCCLCRRMISRVFITHCARARAFLSLVGIVWRRGKNWVLFTFPLLLPPHPYVSQESCCSLLLGKNLDTSPSRSDPHTMYNVHTHTSHSRISQQRRGEETLLVSDSWSLPPKFDLTDSAEKRRRRVRGHHCILTRGKLNRRCPLAHLEQVSF